MIKIKKIYFLLLFFFFIFNSFKAYAFNFGFVKSKNNERVKILEVDHNLIVNNNGAYIGPDDKCVYFTFDCGYENGYTKDILKTLKKHNVKAMFFITGHYLKSSSDIVDIMIEDGHVVANHSYSHKNFSRINENEMINDLKKLEDLFYEKYGFLMPKYVRPPEGSISCDNQKALSDNGYKSIYWSIAYIDWYKDKYYGNDYSYNNVVGQLHNGAIILMHTVSKDNMMDLDKIICGINKAGYSIKCVSDFI